VGKLVIIGWLTVLKLVDHLINQRGFELLLFLHFEAKFKGASYAYFTVAPTSMGSN
jgi:hypothetical protein